jgi:dTMP kinase
MVEDYLNGNFGSIDEVSPRVTSIFYAVDRFAIKKKMIEAINSGKVIISNRYVSSNQGYQGAKIKNDDEREEFFSWLDNLEYNIFGIPRANLYIFLDVPPSIGQLLVDQKGDREYIHGKKRDIHEADREFLETSYKVYKQLSKGDEWVTINCVENEKLLSKEAISELIMKEVKKAIG